MSKSASFIRMAILLGLSLICLCGIFSEPLEDSATWSADFYLSKSLGFIAGYGVYRLYKRWNNDPMIARYIQWCERQTGEGE